ncbi:substrate-binding domain-containing protein [Lysobacter gummosus]|uniref:substrate-binding domain-containing protein n=1 Tax=Lysobacter gummosus TaxID=262324 RepID=UPI003632898E
MHRNTLSLSRIAFATALVIAAGSATAADLYGGGATFPAPAYVGDAYNATTPNKARLSRAASIIAPAVGFNVAGLSNSATGPSAGKTPVFAFVADGLSYCQTGSGTGKKVLNQDTVAANGACGDAASPAATGFSALSPTPDFIGTDSPTSTADYTTFNTNMQATRGAITQIPVLAGAIGIPYNKSTVASLDLNAEKVCKIFGKVVTNWSDPVLGLSGVSGPITVVYRTDGSGTSFAFSSYLSSACASFGISITPNQNFATAVGGAGAGWVGANGNGGVVSAVKNTAGAIAYADIAEILAQSATYAKVNTFDPAVMPVWLNLTGASLVSNKVLDGATQNAIPGTHSAAEQTCMKLIPPNTNVSGAYPIVAYTYINTYYTGHAATQSTALKNLLRVFYSTKLVGASPFRAVRICRRATPTCTRTACSAARPTPRSTTASTDPGYRRRGGMGRRAALTRMRHRAGTARPPRRQRSHASTALRATAGPFCVAAHGRLEEEANEKTPRRNRGA